MTREQLAILEAELGRTLPEEYRRVAEDSPFRPVGNDAVYWFYSDPMRVRSATLAPLADGDYSGAGWRTSFLAIGESPAGDLYLMETAEPQLPIWMLDHETHELTCEWSSFAEFVHEWQQFSEHASVTPPAADSGEVRWALAWQILIGSIGVPLLAWWAVWWMR
ncbi:SMI1/KNR4 family protein [Tuwongella immobilis]|uniref:Knr4/Smi1-like domain-containing protein n=1 Tax=Tuwongella immobilis TaxID=692036 RepID=A0A6C2YVV2_9BACT|nr:SMI1/KNR4 family protein [Tuwongella immobilis]VIP04992.1 Uncharacterized protein OS=Pedosphaera parvula (strain Ellin514) GN=Cflav_PD5517 PE=4 SV=1 [Tuwongella immobilis]VTS07342.1 Uncharacterized protein OS=Pedosphaera parvula (strain Ellin514) GN=Cflav_PD5517 PE=4 SV=1 [Tuwongella immobilis]